MTITRALEIYEEYKKSGRENVFDFGFRYMGMGHIEVVIDLDDLKYFQLEGAMDMIVNITLMI